MIVYKLEYYDQAGYQMKKYNLIGYKGKLQSTEFRETPLEAIHNEMEWIINQRKSLIDRYTELQKMENEFYEYKG